MSQSVITLSICLETAKNSKCRDFVTQFLTGEMWTLAILAIGFALKDNLSDRNMDPIVRWENLNTAGKDGKI